MRDVFAGLLTTLLSNFDLLSENGVPLVVGCTVGCAVVCGVTIGIIVTVVALTVVV